MANFEDIKNIPECIFNIMDDIGFPQNILGYNYLAKAVEMTVDDGGLSISMTRVIYPGVADTFDTTASRAERAIRHAIEIQFDRADPKVLKKYFGNSLVPNEKPSNSQVIYTLANYIRRNNLI